MTRNKLGIALAVLPLVLAMSSAAHAQTGNIRPTAVFTADVTSGPAPLTVVLDGRRSFDSDGFIAGYRLIIPDGRYTRNPALRWTLNTPGTHRFWLEVTDDRGATDVATLDIVVTQGSTAPAVSVEWNPAPESVYTVGEAIAMGWRVRGGSSVEHVNVHYGFGSDVVSNPAGYSNATTDRDGAVSFNAGGVIAAVYMVVHARVDGVDHWSAVRQLRIDDATTTTNPAPRPFGLTRRDAAPTVRFPVTQPRPTGVEFVRAFPNLSFSRPTFLTAPNDGSDRIFVLEQGGRIYVFPNRDDVRSTEVSLFLDISSRVVSSGEQGLLGLAFDPDYARNGRFYIYYSRSGRSIISRFNVSSDPNRASSSSEQVLLQVSQPYTNHNGGMLAFGPDDMLYIGLGDGGSGGDPHGHGQNLGTLLGSILRIDVSGSSGYRIPSDNPFVNTGGARGEIWAYGIRNPWRFAFDRGTGELWCGDVGQNAREEVDIIVRGGNYGWNVFEGTQDYQNPRGISSRNFNGPVLDYSHSLGRSITGGYVYRGSNVPNAVGLYFYGDYVSGRVWMANRSGANQQIDSVSSVSSFGEDRDGELYAVSHGGRLYRLAPSFGGAAPVPVPTSLSATGLFASTSGLRPAPGVYEYDVNSPLWSDGAEKRRWLAIPGTQRIGFRSTGPWSFPTGSILIKHFELEMTVGDPSSARRLETRVLVKQADGGWAGYVYKWNSAQTDAFLLGEAGATEVYTIADRNAPNGRRQQTYTYPSRGDCNACHTDAAGGALGPRTRQMNRDFAYPNATDNQLRALNNIGMFDRDIGAASDYDALADPSDTSRSLADRARSYLASNCSMCHLPSGPAPGTMDLRYGIATSSMNAVFVRPSEGTLGLPDAYRIKSGVKESSVVFERMRRRDSVQMPPIATHEVDRAGLDLIGRWIDSGP